MAALVRVCGWRPRRHRGRLARQPARRGRTTSGLAVSDGDGARAACGPFETVTAVLRLGRAARPRSQAARRRRRSEPPDPPEPAQPVYTRYWLHGKGPAPAGNVPVAVHFTPTRVTLGGTATAPSSARATPPSACQLSRGLRPRAGQRRGRAAGARRPAAEVDRRAGHRGRAAAASTCPGPTGSRRWDVAVSAPPGAAAGRYFVAAGSATGSASCSRTPRSSRSASQAPPTQTWPPEELFFRLQSDVRALAGEADLEVLTPELRLAPGRARRADGPGRQPPGCRLRGELQLISPFGTWQATAPWTQAVTVPPGGEATARFAVTVPATADARLGVLAAGEADVLRPRPLLAGGPAHGDLTAGFAAVLRPRAVSP